MDPEKMAEVNDFAIKLMKPDQMGEPFPLDQKLQCSRRTTPWLYGALHSKTNTKIAWIAKNFCARFRAEKFCCDSWKEMNRPKWSDCWYEGFTWFHLFTVQLSNFTHPAWQRIQWLMWTTPGRHQNGLWRQQALFTQLCVAQWCNLLPSSHEILPAVRFDHLANSKGLSWQRSAWKKPEATSYIFTMKLFKSFFHIYKCVISFISHERLGTNLLRPVPSAEDPNMACRLCCFNLHSENGWKNHGKTMDNSFRGIHSFCEQHIWSADKFPEDPQENSLKSNGCGWHPHFWLLKMESPLKSIGWIILNPMKIHWHHRFLLQSPYGGFLSHRGTPVIIHSNGIFPYKPSSWGYLHFRKVPYEHLGA